MIKGNLVIIDDEPLILKRLKFILDEYADNIYTAENGADGIHLLKEFEIHCVICDINMPKMNGVEVIKNIRAAGNEVPFIFYTGHGNNELMMEAIKYGAFDFLNIPSLDGLEDVTLRGLRKGLKKDVVDDKQDQEAFVSDYQKILDELNK